MAIALDKELRKAGESGCFGSEKAMEGKNLGPERQIQEPSSQCAKACLDILRHRLKNTANSDGEQRRFVRITRVDEAFCDPPSRGRGAVPTFLQKKTGRRRDQVVMPSFDEALYRGYAGKP
jgi:hypothetical protein